MKTPPQERRPVGRPQSSDRLRKQISLTQKHIDVLMEIAIENDLKVEQGKYKNQPNINAAIVWLIKTYGNLNA